MAVLQVYQAKLLQSMDVSGLDPTAFKELRSMTDLALCTTKATVQAIDRSMSSLVMLEHHLWLTLMEIKDADKVPVTKFGRRKEADKVGSWKLG